jgi:hypothetical protein
MWYGHTNENSAKDLVAEFLGKSESKISRYRSSLENCSFGGK